MAVAVSAIILRRLSFTFHLFFDLLLHGPSVDLISDFAPGGLHLLIALLDAFDLGFEHEFDRDSIWSTTHCAHFIY